MNWVDLSGAEGGVGETMRGRRQYYDLVDARLPILLPGRGRREKAGAICNSVSSIVLGARKDRVCADHVPRYTCRLSTRRVGSLKLEISS